MKAIEHPSYWIKKDIAASIRSTAREAEFLRQLHPIQLETIHRERWLRMFVPKNFGGLEWDLREALQAQEALAWADGSTAWVVTLCAGAAWFIGFLNPDLAKEIFSKDLVFFAGSGTSTGTAELLPHGYRLNGKWKYASGAPHANLFTANFLIRANGKLIMEPNGSPQVRAFMMKREEVSVHETWNRMGMIATASHSFEARDLVVAKDRIFHVDPMKAVIDKPIYRYPFLQLAETTLAVILSGLAARFLELFGEVAAQEPKRNEFREIARRFKTQIDDQRKDFYHTVDLSWKRCSQKKLIEKSELERVSEASQALAKISLWSTDVLYPCCGLTSADQNFEINRVWRNIHTASQHGLFRHYLTSQVYRL